MKRVLILATKAGAGHIRAAAAIEDALQRNQPQVAVRNADALEFTHTAFRRSYTSTYNKLAADLPSVWGYIYEQMERKSVRSRTKRLANLIDRMNSTRLLNMVRDYDPDAIVCTHYLPAEVLGPQRVRGRLRAPLFVTLTDFDIHTMWIQNGVDTYFVATEEMAYALREKGIGASAVRVVGIPIMSVFSQTFPKPAAMRATLGIRPETPTVLVAAGGFGMAGVDETVVRLADAVENVQIIAVAGRNETLHRQLRAAAETRKGKVVPLGFANNMHELMAASDLMVTKSGGLTSSECLAMGLPMVIYNPIRGQEERNADFLLESGVAVRANSSAHLVYKFRALLADRTRLARMRAAARLVARPRAACDIAEAVAAALHL